MESKITPEQYAQALQAYKAGVLTLPEFEEIIRQYWTQHVEPNT